MGLVPFRQGLAVDGPDCNAAIEERARDVAADESSRAGNQRRHGAAWSGEARSVFASQVDRIGGDGDRSSITGESAGDDASAMVTALASYPCARRRIRAASPLTHPFAVARMAARRPRSRPPVISRRRRWVQLIAQAIPTLTEWGMIVLVAGLAIAGAWQARAASRSRGARR